METAEENAQRALWNGPAGQAWVDAQDLLDRQLAPMERILTDSIAATGAKRILDVGCGTGTTTLAAAARLGDDAHCTGIDISGLMVAAARGKAAQTGASVEFLEADAQTHAFAAASFDLIASRFGVMFFDNPVAAFANLRRATRTGGALRMVVWRTAAENPFMTTAERVAAPLMPGLPERRPDEPGQFGFGDKGRVEAILQESGWGAVDIRPIDAPCSFPRSGLEKYIIRLGPVGRALAEADEDVRARVQAALVPAFAPFVKGDQVEYTAACWMVSAKAE
ncbi:MAG: class I SAM-dependent methyltransferase [Pseudomonadota bacterium]